jgi:hypothetical protein
MALALTHVEVGSIEEQISQPPLPRQHIGLQPVPSLRTHPLLSLSPLVMLLWMVDAVLAALPVITSFRFDSLHFTTEMDKRRGEVVEDAALCRFVRVKLQNMYYWLCLLRYMC